MNTVLTSTSGACLIKQGRNTSRLVARAAPAREGIECLWYPGATPPAHLDGSLPGDYGFDPFSLAKNPEWLPWFVEAEKTNGRYAMAATAGIIFTDLVGLPKWWDAGEVAIAGSPFDINTLIAVEIAFFGACEYFRYKNWMENKTMDCLGPIAPFDPLNMASKSTQIKEIKNGRLAMMSFIGYVVQYALTGLGPIDCLKKHLESPVNNTIYQTSIGAGFCMYSFLFVFIPLMKELEYEVAPVDVRKEEPARYSVIPWGLLGAPVLLMVVVIHYLQNGYFGAPLDPTIDFLEGAGTLPDYIQPSMRGVDFFPVN